MSKVSNETGGSGYDPFKQIPTENTRFSGVSVLGPVDDITKREGRKVCVYGEEWRDESGRWWPVWRRLNPQEIKELGL